MKNSFQQLDRSHTEVGEAGIVNDHFMNTLVAAAVGFCRQRQNSTIFVEATNAYRGMRAINARAGIQE